MEARHDAYMWAAPPTTTGDASLVRRSTAQAVSTELPSGDGGGLKRTRGNLAVAAPSPGMYGAVVTSWTSSAMVGRPKTVLFVALAPARRRID